MLKQVCALAMTIGAIVGLHVAGAFVWTGLYPLTWYGGLDALYLLFTGQLAFAAFSLAGKGQGAWRSALSNGAMVLAGLCFALAVFDLYVIAFRLDTSGLGGIEVFTHKNWAKRYARSNQLGYWERDLSPYLQPRPPGRERVIAAVGDSWTWGQGVPRQRPALHRPSASRAALRYFPASDRAQFRTRGCRHRRRDNDAQGCGAGASRFRADRLSRQRYRPLGGDRAVHRGAIAAAAPPVIALPDPEPSLLAHPRSAGLCRVRGRICEGGARCLCGCGHHGEASRGYRYADCAGARHRRPPDLRHSSVPGDVAARDR